MDPSRRSGACRVCFCIFLVVLFGRLCHSLSLCWIGTARDASQLPLGGLLHIRPIQTSMSQDVTSTAEHQTAQRARERQSTPLVALAGSKRAASTASFVGSQSQDLNLFGQQLKPCSREGDTTTGWTRSGFCAWEPSDSGYHQVCVTMSQQFLQSSTKYDANDLSSVVQDGGHWCICAWAWAAAVSRDPEHFENLKLDCARTNAYLRDVYQSYSASGQGLTSPSGVQYEAQAALEAVDRLCSA
ncbi:unnamed protein product [Symbiodinium sp. CCMP2592]|nr:unnamed protein product [Symbiodinium sp. CCMP2592]